MPIFGGGGGSFGSSESINRGFRKRQHQLRQAGQGDSPYSGGGQIGGFGGAPQRRMPSPGQAPQTGFGALLRRRAGLAPSRLHMS